MSSHRLPKTVAELAEIKEQADPWRRLGRCIDRRRRVAAIGRSVIAVAAFGAAPLMVADIAPLVPARIVMPAGLPAAARFVMPSVLSGDRAGDDTADGKGEDQNCVSCVNTPKLLIDMGRNKVAAQVKILEI